MDHKLDIDYLDINTLDQAVPLISITGIDLFMDETAIFITEPINVP